MDYELSSIHVEADFRLHEHCNNCILPQNCANGLFGCPVINCSAECGRSMHACKQEDHLELCPEYVVACSNALHGCPLEMKRRCINEHLKFCPASVIECGRTWNRQFLSKTARQMWKDCRKNPITIPENEDSAVLDVAFAHSDQQKLMDLLQFPNSFWKPFAMNRNPGIPKHMRSHHFPTLPFNPDPTLIPVDLLSNEKDTSSDEDMKSKKSPVARECIICHRDPSSQHLHTLGGLIIEDTDLNQNVPKRSKTKKKITVPLPIFHGQHCLLLP